MKDVKLGRLFGIPVSVGWSWLLLPAIIILPIESLPQVLFGCFVSISLAIIILAHEFGHGLAAQYLGYEVAKIRLFGLGGQAYIPGLANPTPKMEIITTVAGPLVNIVLAVVFFSLHISLAYMGIVDGGNQYLITWWLSNALIGVFNFIPAFPMDGGRIFRASLSIFYGHVIATRAATTLSFALSFGMILAGLYLGNIILILVAIFVILVSLVERKNVDRGEFGCSS